MPMQDTNTLHIDFTAGVKRLQYSDMMPRFYTFRQRSKGEELKMGFKYVSDIRSGSKVPVGGYCCSC